MDTLQQTTLWQALNSIVSRHGNRVALIGVDRELTWGQLQEESTRIARLFVDMGLGPGDVVGLCVTKRLELVVAFFALSRIGAIAAPVNFKLEPGHLVDQFTTSEVKAVVLESAFDDVIKPLVYLVGDRILYVDQPSRYSGYHWADKPAVGEQELGPEPQPNDPTYYNYTSGSTGRPKGAISTHENILWNAQSGVTDLGFGSDEVFLCMFSAFSHPHELFHRALLTGATCIVVDTLSPRVVAQLVEKHRITWIMAVPSFYEMMLDHVDGESFDVSSLRVLEAGGAWVSSEMLERMEARYGCPFMPVWGSTETNGVVLALRPDRKRVEGATGQVLESYEVGVFDSRGRAVPAGEVGELWVRGRGVSDSYVHMPQSTKRAFADGWYRTSDLVWRDEEDFYFFAGRLNEMLKVGGIRVFPLEIERVLIAHSDVVEVAVVRAEDRIRGEIPRAVVALRADADANVAQLKAWCRDHLAVFKVPRIIEIWPSLPRLPNGKLDRSNIATTSNKVNREDE